MKKVYNFTKLKLSKKLNKVTKGGGGVNSYQDIFFAVL